MIRGPLEYVPPVEVEVVTKRKAIPLDENEGIYVRHVKSGKVRVQEMNRLLELGIAPWFWQWIHSKR